MILLFFYSGTVIFAKKIAINVYFSIQKAKIHNWFIGFNQSGLNIWCVE